MNILHKEIDEVEFQDVIDLCKAETLESAVLDYKKAIPKDLAKHFATFSNTLGGLIIVGVEEDSTGKPKTFEGLVYDAKMVDQIHQFATNVEPFPRYKIHVTNEVKGKVFILVKILQGDLPPYMPHKDTTVWIRTGNISTPLRNPDSRELEQMYKKREKASKIREGVLKTADEFFNTALEYAEKERVNQLSQGEKVTEDSVGQYAANFRITIMPISPSDEVVGYREIKEKLMDYRVQSRWYGDFPDLNYETVQHGVSFFNWSRHDAGYDFGLILDNGLIDSRQDVLRYDKTTKVKNIYISNLLGYTMRQIQAAKAFYSKIGYNGLLDFRLELTGVKNSLIFGMQPDGWSIFDHGRDIAKQDKYEWESKELDTFKLSEMHELVKVVTEVLQKIYWGFGKAVPQQQLINDQLKQFGWNLPDEQQQA